MKRALAALFAATVLVVLAGCQVANRGNCYPPGGVAQGGEQCPPYAECAWRHHNGGCCPHCGGFHHTRHGQEGYAGGPPTGQVTYPYYTLRGPRDFLEKVPTPIGP